MITVVYSDKIQRRGHFGAEVWVWTFRCGHFGADVSAWTFRRGGFDTVVWATSNCNVRERHIVRLGSDTMSSLDRTQCRLWNRRSVLPLWNRHIVLVGKGTLSSVGSRHRPLWKKHNVLCGKQTISFLESRQRPLWKSTQCPL